MITLAPLVIIVLLLLFMIFTNTSYKVALEEADVNKNSMEMAEKRERLIQLGIISYANQVLSLATTYNWKECGVELHDKRQYAQELVNFIKSTGYVDRAGNVCPDYSQLEAAYREYRKAHPQTWQETVRLIKTKRESGEWRINYGTQGQQDEYLAAIIEYVTDREFVGTHLEAEKKYILHEERRMARGNKIDPIIAGAVAGALFATGAATAKENMKQHKGEEAVWREL